MPTFSDVITPTRHFNLAYIILDSAFLVVFLTLLALKKEWRTLIFAIIGGVLYFAVDYGLFYAATHSRTVTIEGTLQGDGGTALVLLWMSLSYGITNFAFIWLCLKKDKWLWLWLSLIVGWWLIAPSLSAFGGEATIETFRTTGKYHWVMAVIFAVGYLGLLIYDLFTKKKMVNLAFLFVVGFAVQFGWEGALLLNGIRPLNENSLVTLLVDSVLETNLGMPYFLLIYALVCRRWGYEPNSNETLKRVKLGIEEWIEPSPEKGNP